MSSFPMMSNTAHARNIYVSMEHRKKLIDDGTIVSSGAVATNKDDQQLHSGWGTKNYHCGMTNGTNMTGTMKNLINIIRIKF